MKVTDAVSSTSTGGFIDGYTGTLNDYEYDDNGNMIVDRNKGISEILYNHLNLPTYIYIDNKGVIEYLYNAAGQKLRKTVNDTQNNTIKVVEYLDGFQTEERGSRMPVGALATQLSNNEQYARDILQFFPHPEGYVRATPLSKAPPFSYQYDYVYNYTDHLGNIRVSYTQDPVSNELKILEENHYYPFGLKHAIYDTGGKKDYQFDENDPEEIARPGFVTSIPYQYKYNGKEFQDELGLNMYAMDLRQYDPAIARWVVMDPVTHHSMSPYNAFDNNPVFWADPSGMDGEHYNWETGRYEDDKGNEVSFETAMASVGLNPDGSQQENEDQVPLYDKDKYKDVQVMDKIGTIEKILQFGYKRKWSPDGFTTYLVNDDGFVEGITTTVIGGAGSLEFIGGAGVLLLKVPKYLKYIKEIKTAKDLLRYGVKASKSFELLRTGGKYKAVIEGGAFGAGQYYTQLLKEGWQAVPLSKGGFKLIKDGSEIFFRSSKSGGRKALDTFTLPKAYNGKNVDLFFK